MESKTATATATATGQTAMAILLGVSVAHLLNDAMQTVVPAMFPILQGNLKLTFTQIGWVAFTLNVTASVLQPLIGIYTDRRPLPMLLPLGMVFSLLGMIAMAFAPSLGFLLLAAALIGVGSSVLHPESSRVAHLAARKGKGLAQSIFQVGGNTGQALAPLMVAYILSPQGQLGFLWFTILAVIGIVVQTRVGRWYRAQLQTQGERKRATAGASETPRFSRRFIGYAMTILVLLLFSKFVYLAAMTGYYAFYYMETYGRTLKEAQLALFALQFAGMAGTFLGGPLADRFGRKNIIWFSILGTAPFALLLPYVGPTMAIALSAVIGLILMSGFSVIIVYAQEMLPGHVGTIAGLFFGVSFGLAGLGSVAIGSFIDGYGVERVIQLCALLPLLGVLAMFLPRDRTFMKGQRT